MDRYVGCEYNLVEATFLCWVELTASVSCKGDTFPRPAFGVEFCSHSHRVGTLDDVTAELIMEQE